MNDTIINNSVFTFNSIPFPFLVAAFKLHNILLSAGNVRKRGLLSPVHLRLAQFVTCLEGMQHNTIFDSYHYYDKLATQPVFDHTILNKVQGFKNTTHFFNLLEQFFRLKLNVPNDVTNFDLLNLFKNNQEISL